MAKRRNTNKFSVTSILSVILVLILIVFSKIIDNQKKAVENHVVTSDKEAIVHFIDVGQGSATLIQCGENGILVDAGEAEYGQKVCDYIKASGVKNLEYVIASHPHSDHIGGMKKVIKTFSVKHCIMPDIVDENVPTTAVYEKLLITLDEKNVDVDFWKYGDPDTVGIENVTVKLMAPVVQNDSLNNMSLICKVAAFNTVFILPADAENTELKSLMKTDPNVMCDVMAMSHHGSSNALYRQFLQSADFSVAVISCGAGNSYGHPHKEVIEYLFKNSIPYYRTDQLGSIRFICNENGYAIESENG